MGDLNEYLTHVSEFMDRPSYERLVLEEGDYWATASVTFPTRSPSPRRRWSGRYCVRVPTLTASYSRS